MRWWDYHLYEFVIGDRVDSAPLPDDEMYERKVYKAKALRLGTLIERGVREFLYVYDIGDYWRHRITIEDIRQGAPVPNTPTSWWASAALPRKTLEVSLGSMNSSKRWPIPSTKTTSRCWNGTAPVIRQFGNADGVCFSYYEWEQNNENEQWELEDINRKMRRKMERATDAVLARQRCLNAEPDAPCLADLRLAAIVTAVEPIANITLQRGIWP